MTLYCCFFTFGDGILLHTAHCTLHTAHCTQHSEQCTMHNAQSTLEMLTNNIQTHIHQNTREQLRPHSIFRNLKTCKKIKIDCRMICFNKISSMSWVLTKKYKKKIQKKNYLNLILLVAIGHHSSFSFS